MSFSLMSHSFWMDYVLLHLICDEGMQLIESKKYFIALSFV